MTGLWRNDPETPEGKYPIILRRDGTPLESQYFVMTLKDSATHAALYAYADKGQDFGFDPKYLDDIRELARQSELLCISDTTADPDAPRHRTDDPAILAWARSIGNPGS